MALSLDDAIQLVTEHINEFNLPNELEISLLNLITAITVYDNNTAKCTKPAMVIYPWNWKSYAKDCKSWFTHNKIIPRPIISIANVEGSNFTDNLSDQTIIGLMEIFAGALLCIIPHPVAYTVGGGLLLDGIKRSLDSQDVEFLSPYSQSQANTHIIKDDPLLNEFGS